MASTQMVPRIASEFDVAVLEVYADCVKTPLKDEKDRLRNLKALKDKITKAINKQESKVWVAGVNKSHAGHTRKAVIRKFRHSHEAHVKSVFQKAELDQQAV